MKARAGLMERINASLDLLEARKQQDKAEGRAGREEGQLTALDLLLASEDEEGKGLTRQGARAGARGAGGVAARRRG